MHKPQIVLACMVPMIWQGMLESGRPPRLNLVMLVTQSVKFIRAVIGVIAWYQCANHGYRRLHKLRTGIIPLASVLPGHSKGTLYSIQ